MDSITILHRNQTASDILMPTPILSEHYFQSLLNGCWCSNEDGKDRFRIKGNLVEYSNNADYQDIQASMELLQIKGVKEILPQGTGDFCLMVHEAGQEKGIEAVNPDYLEEVEKEISAMAKQEPKVKGLRRRIE
jgi:hypothetical protein